REPKGSICGLGDLAGLGLCKKVCQRGSLFDSAIQAEHSKREHLVRLIASNARCFTGFLSHRGPVSAVCVEGARDVGECIFGIDKAAREEALMDLLPLFFVPCFREFRRAPLAERGSLIPCPQSAQGKEPEDERPETGQGPPLPCSL